MLLTIFGILSTLIGPLLSKLGVSASIDNLITAALAGIQGVIVGIKSNAPVSAALTALQAALVALEADTTLDPTVLGDVSEGISALKAAIAAYLAAEVTTDPGTLTPIPEI